MLVISFYFIALLYMKVSKFDDLERKQNKLMKEMDDAISAYLIEVKEENDKLIQKLTAKVAEQETSASFEYKVQDEPMDAKQEELDIPVTIPKHTIRNHARKSYETVKQHSGKLDIEEVEESPKVQKEVPLDDRARAIQLSKEGLSIEEIAKELDKGRTEIELILKFN